MTAVENLKATGVLRLNLLSGSRTESPGNRSAIVLAEIFGKFISLTMNVDVTSRASVSIAIKWTTLDESGQRKEHDEGTVTGRADSVHALHNGAGSLRIVDITENHAIIELSPT